MTLCLAVAPWGKRDRLAADPAEAATLSLVGHCIDVAAVTRALLDLPTWRRRLQALAGCEFTEATLDRLTVLAFLHDAGKAGAGFFSKGLAADVRADWLHHAHRDARQLGHTRVVAPLLGFDAQYAPARSALGVTELAAWGGGSDYERQPVLELWLAAVSHHGDPISVESLTTHNPDPPVYPTWTLPVAGYDPLHGLNLLREAAQSLWPAAYATPQPPLRPSQALIHAFAGLVSLADWIGSDTQFFPYDLGGVQDERRWCHALRAARLALQAMRIDLEASRADLVRRAPGFGAVFGFEPKPMQSLTAQLPPVSPVVLEAETGSGKTEAALWRFRALFEAGEVDALCFLLPTRVAATGISSRLEAFVERLFPDPALRPNTVLAVPGYLHANGEDGQRLAPFTVLWPDKDSPRPMFWAAEHSKRYFAGAVAAATIDQFLLSTLQTRHAHLRGSTLLRSLVVVDEVHASDPYMRALLGKALQRHLSAGGHALLLSATLTQDFRSELLRCAPSTRPARGLGRTASRARAAEEASVPEPAADYPCVSAPGRVTGFGAMTEHKRIAHRVLPLMRDPEAVAALALPALQAGARVLILRNTVRQAVATQQALERLLGPDHQALFRCKGVVALHHGRYAFSDRQVLDREVGQAFGKDAATVIRPVVLCATQTVEISVDCDADFMITDLAPMDVLLQRLGRLHRHRARDDHRPAGFERPRCVVLAPPQAQDGDLSLLLQSATGLGLGARSAYPDLLCLQATLDALRDAARFPVLDIPKDNRALVERCCGRPALQALANTLGGPWPAFLSELQGQASAQGSAALYQCIDWSRPWREAVPGELSTPAKARLGLDGVQVDLPGAPTSAFGHTLGQLTLPVWMLPDTRETAGEPPLVQRIAADEHAVRFSIGGRWYSYDRHGLAIGGGEPGAAAPTHP